LFTLKDEKKRAQYSFDQKCRVVGARSNKGERERKRERVQNHPKFFLSTVTQKEE